MKKNRKIKVVFFGDSVTQMGMDADGYIVRLKEMLEQRGLTSKFDLIGAGIGYDKVYDLYLRMDNDVIAENPDMVFIWIGLNDVGHKVTGTGTDPEKFERFYIAILKKLQLQPVKIVLVTPAVIGERKDGTNPQDGDMNYYAKMVKGLALQYNCQLVDLRKSFTDYIFKNNPENKESGILTSDRIHPNGRGHILIAEKMMEMLITGYKADYKKIKTHTK